MSSPTSRSLKELRDTGWSPAVVETFNHWTKRRRDLYGIADIIAVKPGEIPILVQTTSGSNLAARRTKILENELAPICLQSGFRIVLHGWRKLKVKRGGKAMRWALREEDVTLAQWGEP